MANLFIAGTFYPHPVDGIAWTVGGDPKLLAISVAYVAPFGDS